jgi:chromosome segregation ATPase
MQQQTTVIIVAAIVTNLLLLLGFGLLVPRWLRRQDTQAADEASRLREMLLDVLSEQEAVTIRQAQLGAELTTMHEQLGKLAEAEPARFELAPAQLSEAAGLPQIEQGLQALRREIGSWFDREAATEASLHAAQRLERLEERENWTQLLGLLATMQDRIAELNGAVVQQPQARQATDRLLQELESEMQNLRGLADEIAGIQWKLRRSVLERENRLASLRAQVVDVPKFGNRAA